MICNILCITRRDILSKHNSNKMCDLGSHTTSFKGVVITGPTMFVLLFTFSYIMSVRSMSINSKGSEQHLNINSDVGCAYLESSKELNCFCQTVNDNTSLRLPSPNKAIKLTDLFSGADVFKSFNQLNEHSSTKLDPNILQQGTNYRILSLYQIFSLIFY